MIRKLVLRKLLMKYFYTIFFAVLLLLAGGCGKERKPKLVMVTSASFAPYEYIERGKIIGIDPAIVGTIAEKLGYELEIQDMAFESVIAAVQSGKADIAASGITITEERKKQVAFTDPYVVAKQVVVVKHGSPVYVNNMRKFRIGVQHGTTGDLYVTKNIGNPERYSNVPLAVAALGAGKLDVVVADQEPAVFSVRRRSGLKILPEPLTFEEYAFAISKKNPELLKKFNAELRQMKKSGELDSIISEYRKKVDPDTKSSSSDQTKGFFGAVASTFKTNFVEEDRYLYLLNGFFTTIKISFFAVLLGVVIGACVAMVRSTADQTGNLKILDLFCRIYLTVIRGTPVVVQLLIIYFVIFGAVDVDKVMVAIIAFGINSGAYVAEIFRSGIMSIDKGQMEAGRSLGLSYWQSMREIIVPQAFKNVLPALGNEFIVLLKETSVAGYIALQDLTKGGDIIRSQTYDAFMPLVAVALIYLVVVMLLSWMLRRLEIRLKKNE